MAEKIRLGVWLVGVVPLVLVAGGVAALLLAPHKSPAPRYGESSSASPPEPTPIVNAPPPSAVAGLDPPTSPPLPVPVPSPAFIVPGGLKPPAPPPPAEPIPELDTRYWRPDGSDQWTWEQKVAFRKEALAKVDARERQLERDIAAAKRSGDGKTEQEKTATLSYLRWRRAQLEDAIRAQEEAGAVQNSNEVR